jgi:protein-disulfide isomerase
MRRLGSDSALWTLVDRFASVLTLVVAIGVLVAVLGTRSRPPANSLELPEEPIRLDSLPRLGDAEAAVALVLYSDFECPYCQRFAIEVLPALRQRFIDSGKLQVAFWHLPNERAHPLALRASEAAACAGRQDMFWSVHDRLFEEPGLTEQVLEAAIMESALDYTVFDQCLQDHRVKEMIRQGVQQASRLGITATPTLLLGWNMGGSLKAARWFVGVNNARDLEAAVQELVDRPPR